MCNEKNSLSFEKLPSRCPQKKKLSITNWVSSRLYTTSSTRDWSISENEINKLHAINRELTVELRRNFFIMYLPFSLESVASVTALRRTNKHRHFKSQWQAATAAKKKKKAKRHQRDMVCEHICFDKRERKKSIERFIGEKKKWETFSIPPKFYCCCAIKQPTNFFHFMLVYSLHHILMAESWYWVIFISISCVILCAESEREAGMCTRIINDNVSMVFGVEEWVRGQQ